MKRIARIILLTTLAALALPGCAAFRTPAWPVESLDRHQPVTEDMAIESLALEIASLDDTIDPAEAFAIADTSLRYVHQLAEEWEVVRPPVFHNILVNSGARPRGLCIHWTEDLLAKLSTLDLKTVDLYWVVAKPRNRFRLEHSSVVVTSKQQVFAEGLVLDGWRNSGMLYWARVQDDKYDWALFDRTSGESIAQSEIDLDALKR